MPFILPATPHIANSRIQIAPTARASVPMDSTYVQSIPAMAASVGQLAANRIDLNQTEDKARHPARGILGGYDGRGRAGQPAAAGGSRTGP